MSEIADEADVSRRTVYQYFPTPRASARRRRARGRAHDRGDRTGIRTLSRAPKTGSKHSSGQCSKGFAETEALGRTIVRLTVGGAGAGGSTGRRPRQDGRKSGRLAAATGGLSGSKTHSSRSAPNFPPEQFERLVSALTLLMGWESMIVLQDTRALSAVEAEEVCVWAARALVAATTGER